MDEQILKIFTLNCWGLRFVSKQRSERIKLIGQHLNEHNYDIVFLQEIWIQSDFEYIRSITESKFKFGQMFKNGSILGTSGLAILIKWIPKTFHFQPFSVNGSPFRPLHGDWFTTKGVGYVRIQLDSINLHLFCTHMHAQYSHEERLTDQYFIHRICQSYEMSKFIRLMTNSSHSNDLVILAGDMNTSSKELPFRLLVNLTELNDCHKFRAKSNKERNGLESGDCLPKRIAIINENSDSDMTDDEHHTCGHRDNTFTETKANGKRIDFILFRLCDGVMKMNNSVDSPIYGVERLTVCCKDESGLSFSDHQPVVALFRIKLFELKNVSKTIGSEDQNLSNNQLSNEENHSIGDNSSLSSGNKRANHVPNGDGSYDRKRLHAKRGSGESVVSPNDVESDISNNVETMGLLSGKQKLTNNILLEVVETASKCGRPLQLKQIASNAIKSKLRINSCHKRDSLEGVKSLLEDYILENQWTFKLFLLYLFIFITINVIFLSILLISTKLTITEVLLYFLPLIIITIFSSILYFLNSRQEKNAIKAIVDDMKVEIILNQSLN